MPATSALQQRFMGMCAHKDHPPSRCPNRKVAREFSHKPPGGYTASKLKARMTGK